jgi:hypothetical protein
VFEGFSDRLSRNCPINPHRPQMSLYRAAKRCDRGFVAPVLVAKAHIEMPFSDLLDSFSRQFVNRGNLHLGELHPLRGCLSVLPRAWREHSPQLPESGRGKEGQ